MGGWIILPFIILLNRFKFMNKLKIAVLDSGFDFHRQLQNPIVYSNSFSSELSPIDKNGHGTCIITLIDSIGTNIEIYNMAILDKNREGNLCSLKSALKESIKKDVNIVNLSLGIENMSVDSELEGILLECCRKKIILVTTTSNRGKLNYLAQYKDILSIQSRNHNRVNNDLLKLNPAAFFVDNIPRVVPWINGTYKLSGANSFLTPFLIKNLYQINKSKNDLEESYKVLLKLQPSSILRLSPKQLEIKRDCLIDKSLYKRMISNSIITDMYNSDGKLIIENATSENVTRLVKLINSITKLNYINNLIWISDIMFIENLTNKLLSIKEDSYG